MQDEPTGMQAMLTAMKMKYTLLPSAARPTGHTWDTMIDPTAPPEAAKLRPLARTAVGKIYVQSASSSWRTRPESANLRVVDP